MAEEREDSSKVKYPSPLFVEVICKSSGKKRRFAASTEAGFAVDVINRKLDGGGIPLASRIEAVKEGEEPISFGPNSVLVDYGQGWKLETVTESKVGPRKEESIDTGKRGPPVEGLNGSGSTEKISQPVISFAYLGKILIAFVMMFVLGAVFTLALENLPGLILYINS
ncbi:hypothetical protein LguiA_024469 [Lonicera macranthoides]